MGKRFWSKELHQYVRSSWEVDIIRILDLLDIKYMYEPRRFYFRKERESYLPDLYIPEYDVWIEIKGWMDKRSRRRCDLFMKYHKDKSFIILEQVEYECILKEPILLKRMIEAASKAKEDEQDGRVY
jgi:hypothetical protein